MPFIDIESLEKREMAPGIRARFVHSENMTVAHWYFDKGAHLPDHSHSHEQITTVLSGLIDFKSGSGRKNLNKGMSVIIPSGVVHGGIALEETYIIDVFYPVRKDYI